ncbi:MAG: chromosome partitioning protein [Actinomycetia bacterium]|nr:chromosome partitioning protein [Actinomycetes bacterium]
MSCRRAYDPAAMGSPEGGADTAEMRWFVPHLPRRSDAVAPWLAALTLTAAGVAAAVGYALTAPKHYRATAQLLVSPVGAGDPAYAGLDVLREAAGGRRTAAASVAALVASAQVANEVRAHLGLPRSRDSLLVDLDARVVGSSDVVAVTFEDLSPFGAARLANAFADALVRQRNTSFTSQLQATILRYEQLQKTPAGQPGGGAATLIQRRLAVLRGLEGRPDPTIRHAGVAAVPAAASWPKLPTLAAVGGGAGFAAGILVALLLSLGRGRRRGKHEPDDQGVPDGLVERLEQRLDERIAALEAERERLSVREAALAVREREISAKLTELREALESAAQLEVVAPAPPDPAAARAPEPEPAAAPPEALEPAGAWNLMVLERLVDDRGDEFPEKRAEWDSYLYSLREYAEPDGSVPASFDRLIQDAFAELLP